MIYNIYKNDWSKWLNLHLFDVIQKDKMTSLVRAFIMPVVKVHNLFLLYMKGVDFELKMTPQTCKLRYGLNARFDTFFNRIFIVDNATDFQDFIFLNSENKPKFLPDFLNENTYDFEVKVPISLSFKEKDIKAFLNIYKLPSTRYLITYF